MVENPSERERLTRVLELVTELDTVRAGRDAKDLTKHSYAIGGGGHRVPRPESYSEDHWLGFLEDQLQNRIDAALANYANNLRKLGFHVLTSMQATSVRQDIDALLLAIYKSHRDRTETFFRDWRNPDEDDDTWFPAKNFNQQLERLQNATRVGAASLLEKFEPPSVASIPIRDRPVSLAETADKLDRAMLNHSSQMQAATPEHDKPPIQPNTPPHTASTSRPGEDARTNWVAEHYRGGIAIVVALIGVAGLLYALHNNARNAAQQQRVADRHELYNLLIPRLQVARETLTRVCWTHFSKVDAQHSLSVFQMAVINIADSREATQERIRQTYGDSVAKQFGHMVFGGWSRLYAAWSTWTPRLGFDTTPIELEGDTSSVNKGIQAACDSTRQSLVDLQVRLARVE